MLRKSYDWVLGFANHPKAVWILGAVSFAESSFFPIPPDPLYMAMLLGQKNRIWFLAFICTITSVVGGWLGYLIGYAFYETIGEWLIEVYKMQDSFNSIQGVFDRWGFWFISFKALTPIPYKFVTLTCGVVHYNFAFFTIASIIARGTRFYMLAVLFWKYGPAMKEYIDQNLTLVTSIGLGALVSGFVILSYWTTIENVLMKLF